MADYSKLVDVESGQQRVQRILCMTHDELEQEETNIEYDIKYGVIPIEDIDGRRKAIQKRRQWLIITAILKSLVLVFSIFAGLALLIIMTYSLFVYVIIPNDRTVWLLLLMLPYLGCNIAGIMIWTRYQLHGMTAEEARRQELFGETPSGEIVAPFSFFGNILFLAAAKWFSSVWQSDMKLFANGADYERLGWRYDVIFYSSLVMIAVYSILTFIDISTLMYRGKIC